MSSVNYIQDPSGNTFIPSTQRPDGSWRRPIRVRDGYVPQEEQPLYVSKGRQDKSPYPPGLSSADFEPKRSASSGAKGSALYFEIGNYEPTTTIPGLNFVKQSPEEKKPVPKKKKKSKSKSISEDEGKPEVKTNQRTVQAPPPASTASQLPSNTSDPVKRLRNLRKKLKDIETLELKIKSGELKNPEKDQLEKIHRKEEVEEEMDEIQNLIERLNLDL